jgi:hypothetical protein
MSFEDPVDEKRRQLLLAMLGAGVLGATYGAPAMGQLAVPAPGPLPAGRSIYRLDGDASINGQPATLSATIRPGDEITTGPRSRIVFAVEQDAFLVRENSRVQLEAPNAVISTVRMLTGALLSVFGRREQPLRLATSVATIGIRGTGVYIESDPEQSYVCTCYGETQLQTTDDPSISETIISQQHDAPRYILAPGAASNRIQPAPFVNHTDDELVMLEALVGREPPFAVFGEGYEGPRIRY